MKGYRGWNQLRDEFMEFIECLSSYSDMITGISTALLVIVTWCLLRASRKPEIVIYLRPDEVHIRWTMLCIENIGTGPARNVRFTTDPSFIPDLDVPLSEISAIKTGINYLGPGWKMQYFLVGVTDKLDKLKQTPFAISVSYRNFMIFRRKHVFSLDFGELEGITNGGSQLLEISDAIHEVKEVLCSLATGKSKPTVLTQSKSEHDLGRTISALERAVARLPLETQQEVLQAIASVLKKKDQEVREERQNEKATTDQIRGDDIEEDSIEKGYAILDELVGALELNQNHRSRHND